jgi:predicted nucleic acid-binding protein
MKRIFLDTGAWDAIADKSDKNHCSSLRFRDEIAGKIILVTSNYVLDELYTLLLMNIGFQKTVAYKRKIDFLINENVLEIVWIDKSVAEKAWKIFERFNADKCWSFTDCTSYAVMKEKGITEVFSFDHHFEQMGFIRKP